jgi:hypothetical protein
LYASTLISGLPTTFHLSPSGATTNVGSGGLGERVALPLRGQGWRGLIVEQRHRFAAQFDRGTFTPHHRRRALNGLHRFDVARAAHTARRSARRGFRLRWD